jgi:Mitochondrial carrier protein
MQRTCHESSSTPRCLRRSTYLLTCSSSHRWISRCTYRPAAVQALTHPIDVVKKRYQITGLQRPLSYGARIDAGMTSSLRACVACVWRHEGAAGFYKGISASLVKARSACWRCTALSHVWQRSVNERHVKMHRRPSVSQRMTLFACAGAACRRCRRCRQRHWFLRLVMIWCKRSMRAGGACVGGDIYGGRILHQAATRAVCGTRLCSLSTMQPAAAVPACAAVVNA